MREVNSITGILLATEPWQRMCHAVCTHAAAIRRAVRFAAAREAARRCCSATTAAQATHVGGGGSVRPAPEEIDRAAPLRRGRAPDRDAARDAVLDAEDLGDRAAELVTD